MASWPLALTTKADDDDEILTFPAFGVIPVRALVEAFVATANLADARRIPHEEAAIIGRNARAPQRA